MSGAFVESVKLRVERIDYLCIPSRERERAPTHTVTWLYCCVSERRRSYTVCGCARTTIYRGGYECACLDARIACAAKRRRSPETLSFKTKCVFVYLFEWLLQSV